MTGHLYESREVRETLYRWDVACYLRGGVDSFPYEGIRKSPRDEELARVVEDILRPINKKEGL